ncbi:MAG: amidinotransferase [Streptosporangiales bacterium]|nr:amidinotransferase [Streptosporangiales bacterium]
MTAEVLADDGVGVAAGRPVRTYLMCPPTHFAVTYAINPWMDPAVPVDRERALGQWRELRATYERLGHRVHTIEPVPGLPDMVFAANGGTVIGGRVLGARFRYPERAAEGVAYHDWFVRAGYRTVHRPEHVNEGEGDFAYHQGKIIAGYGFRTDRAAHDELARVFGLPVVPVELVDPRYYHLDTALCVVDAGTAMYLPEAFTAEGRRSLRELFPDLIAASPEDAAVLGLNAVGDGLSVVLPREATGLAAALAERGYRPVGVDIGELRRAGGGPKCCTLELRP